MSEGQNPAKGMSVAGMILGLVALVFSLVPCFWLPHLVWIPLLLGIVGLVLSAISRSKAKKASAKTGMSTAGLVMSILGIVIVPIIYITVIAAAASIVDELGDQMENNQELQDAFQQLGDQIEDELENQGN